MEKWLPLFIPAVWILVSLVTSLLSGWFSLAWNYPDREQEAVLILKRQSGAMGFGVSMSSVLRMEVCPSGLRAKMNRLFGLFCRPFFVPWREIEITRRKKWMRSMAELRFGNPKIGALSVLSYVADRMAAAVPGAWPEATVPRPENRVEVRRRLLRNWLLASLLPGTVFSIFFLVAIPTKERPPSSVFPVIFLFPAFVAGISFLRQYSEETRA